MTPHGGCDLRSEQGSNRRDDGHPFEVNHVDSTEGVPHRDESTMRSEGRRGFISREFVSEDLGVARQTFDSDLSTIGGVRRADE